MPVHFIGREIGIFYQLVYGPTEFLIKSNLYGEVESTRFCPASLLSNPFAVPVWYVSVVTSNAVLLVKSNFFHSDLGTQSEFS